MLVLIRKRKNVVNNVRIVYILLFIDNLLLIMIISKYITIIIKIKFNRN